MPKFIISERVTILNEVGFFSVKEIKGERIILVDDFGFERSVLCSYVCKTQHVEITHISNKDISEITKKTKSTPHEIPQLDLHGESLEEEWGVRMKKEDNVLEIQLKEFKRFCNRMIDQRQTRFRVIHGIGAGILRQEIRTLLKGREGFTVHDDQLSFGRVGASIIEMRLNDVEKF
ncbi:MAG: Smr/MutS family protein [Bacteroidetes bacterium]|nr:Smr/MutS family protein [Bacteroidota bacterium]